MGRKYWNDFIEELDYIYPEGLSEGKDFSEEPKIPFALRMGFVRKVALVR